MKYIVIIVCLLINVFANSTYDMSRVKDKKTKSSMQKWLDNDLSLKPYRVNYILPYGYSTRKYESKIPTINYREIEAAIQVSLKLQVGKNLFNLNEKYYVSYTQQAFWQIYANSAPFRESTYNPEAFVIIPISDRYSVFKLHSLKLALAHKSNGQPDTSAIVFDNKQSLGNLSRSFNYLYATLRAQYSTLLVDLKVWAPIPEDLKTTGNPDLMDYIGYTSVKFTYFLNDNMFTLMGRGNMYTGKGAIEATYSYPLIHNNLYIKVFSGYTESLINYNNYITKFSIGFSFSR